MIPELVLQCPVNNPYVLSSQDISLQLYVIVTPALRGKVSSMSCQAGEAGTEAQVGPFNKRPACCAVCLSCVSRVEGESKGLEGHEREQEIQPEQDGHAGEQ